MKLNVLVREIVMFQVSTCNYRLDDRSHSCEMLMQSCRACGEYCLHLSEFREFQQLANDLYAVLLEERVYL